MSAIYDKFHKIPVYDRSKVLEERVLRIVLVDGNLGLIVKLFDVNDFTFNYSQCIGVSDFENIKVNQNLEISYSEFKVDLVEMLNQNLQGDMFLKVVYGEEKISLVFYVKSKIKLVNYLVLDLGVTSHKEVFEEMNKSLIGLKEVNERLKLQLNTTRGTLNEKEQKIIQVSRMKQQLEQQFLEDIKCIENVFENRLDKVHQMLLCKIIKSKQKLDNLLRNVHSIKLENNLKLESNTRLIKSLENLRIENEDYYNTIDSLRKDNNFLAQSKTNLEKTVEELKRDLQNLDRLNLDLQNQNDELKKDLEKITVILAQKKESNDELARDLVQANQMIVNFNNHYDMKVKETEELQERVEQLKSKNGDLLKEFDAYKMNFNKNEISKLRHELAMSSEKINQLEDSLRKANRMNGLLTKKLSETH